MKKSERRPQIICEKLWRGRMKGSIRLQKAVLAAREAPNTAKGNAETVCEAGKMAYGDSIMA